MASQRIIVVGAGEVGTHVASILSREGHDVVIIDRDADRIRAVEGELDVETVKGSATTPSVLADAGVSRASMLVAVTSIDEVNMIASLLAKQAGVPRTVVRLEDDELRGSNARELHEAIQADLVIDPDEQAALELIELVDNLGVAEVAELAEGEISVLGARLSPDAPLVGRTLAGLAADYDPEWDFLFGTIARDGHTIIPRGNFMLEANDLVRVVVKKRARRELLALMGLSRDATERVLLLGGGRTAERVMDRLIDRGIEVTVVERDRKRAEYLATVNRRAHVLHGDATDTDLLVDARAGRFDVVAALTGDDDANVLSCLFAKREGAREVIAMVHRLPLLGLLADFGIYALSPRTASANQVLRFIRGDVAAVATFLEGEVEVLELEVKEGSPADGSLVAELRMPKDVLVGARVRDGKAEIARGRSELRERDHVILFAKPHAVDEVHRIFG